MIEGKHLFKRFPDGQEALHDVSFRVNHSELVFLTGHSGAGKSTLLRLLALIDKPTRGSLKVNGHEISRLPPLSIPAYRRNVGIIFQDHRLLPDRNVFENVALPLRIAGVEPEVIARRTRAALDKVGLLRKEKSQPETLSAGQQQRVGIARAIINKPTILLADEPTGNLDPGLSEEIMRLFLDFNQVGVTVLVASHDQLLIHRFGQRVIELNNGCIVQEQQ